MAEGFFAVQFAHHMGAGGLEFRHLGDQGEHHGQGAAIGRADQRLDLHAQHAGFIKADADCAPPHRGVRFILRLHVRQHLVRPDVEGAEGHAAAFCSIHHPGVKGGKLGALRHLGADEKLQFGAEQTHAFGPRSFERRQVGHQPCVHVQRYHRSAQRLGGQAAQAGVAFLRLGLHGDFFAKGAGDGVVGAKVDNALIAVDKNGIAVQRLGQDAVGVDHQRDRQCAGDDGGVRPDGAFVQHHAFQFAPVGQQFGGADVARHQHRVVRHFGPGIQALTGEDAQQAVGQIVKVLQAFTQIGVWHLFQPVAGGGLFLFHRRLGREAAHDVFFHPAQPAARMGEHAVGFEHCLLFFIKAFCR